MQNLPINIDNLIHARSVEDNHRKFKATLKSCVSGCRMRDKSHTPNKTAPRLLYRGAVLMCDLYGQVLNAEHLTRLQWRSQNAPRYWAALGFASLLR